MTRIHDMMVRVVLKKVINTDYYFKDIYRLVDQAKAINSLNHMNFEQNTLKYHSTDKFENEKFNPYIYFGLWDSMYDGEWESSSTNQDTNEFYPSSFTQRRGRVSVKFTWNYVSNFESELKVTIDMYDGEFRNEALNFQIDFGWDFKNASHSYLEVGTINKFKEFTFYRLFRSYYSKNYEIKSLIRKHASKGIFLIEVANYSNNSNTTISISLNPFYSGSKERNQIIETVAIIVILAIFSFLLIKIETLWWKSDILSLYVSPISISIAAFWFVLLGFEHLYLSFSFEDYRWLWISSLAYFWLAAQLVISIKHTIMLKLKNLSINGGILLGILLLVAISILVLNDMIFNPHLMALWCGFVWMPQIFNDIINGFCVDHDYFEYSLTLSMLFIPISVDLFKNNIFEL